MMLLERESPLGSIADYLAQTSAGHGRLVFVGGESGVGKTTLIERVVHDVGSDVRVATGGCDGSTTPAPLAPLREMLPQLPGGVWPDGAARHEVFARLSEALGRSRAPYLLVVEDAHWADDATLDLLRHLGRRVHRLPVLVVVTFRSEEVVGTHPLRLLLGDIANTSGVRRIDLIPLSTRAVRTLVVSAGDDTAELDPEELHAVTGGNPFFVTEVIAAGGGVVPRSVREAVLSRVSRLSPATRQALGLVALAGPRCEVAMVEDLRPGSQGPLDEALGRGVLLLSGETLVFRHELARLAVLDEVPVLQRRSDHQQVLEWLEAHAGEPARMAHHAEDAGAREATYAYALVAAQRAAVLGSHREAVEQYERALRHSPEVEDRALAELLDHLSYEHYVTGRMDEAYRVRLRALEIWKLRGDVVQVGDALRSLSRLIWFLGESDAAEEYAATACATLEGTGGTAEAMAASNRGQLRMLALDLDGTRTWATRALDLVRERDDVEAEEVRVHALNNLGTAEVDSGDASEGFALLEESLHRSQAADLHADAARAFTNLGSEAASMHDHLRAGAFLSAGLAYCAERDLDAWALYIGGWLARSQLDRGELAVAVKTAENVLRNPRTAMVSRIGPLCALALARARLGRGDYVEPLREAHDAAFRIGEAQRIAPVTSVACEIAWIEGDEARLQQVLQEAWPLVAPIRAPWMRGPVVTWLPDAEAAAEVDSVGPPYRSEATRRWEEAASLWDELGSPYAAALALARSGTEEGLAEAAARFDDLGAEGAAARARALAKSSGWSPPRGQRAATRAHPKGLTPREAEIAALLSDGLSNAAIARRLVLSPRTVEHHVAAVMSKLGVSSRHDLRGLDIRGPIAT